MRAATDEAFRRSQAYKVNREGWITKRGDGPCAECGATIPGGARCYSVNVQTGRQKGSCWWYCNACRPLPVAERARMPKNVVALLRVSTGLQDLEPQRRAVQRWAEIEGLDVDFREEHAVKGASKDRPELERILEDARHGRVRTLVVAALDRLGRSMIDTVLRLDELHRLGVRVVCLREGFDFATPMGRFTATVLAALAEMEREQIRARTIAGLAGGVDAEGKRVSVRGRRLGQPEKRVDMDEVRRRAAAGETPEQIAPTIEGWTRCRGADGELSDWKPWRPSASAIRRRLAAPGPAADA